LSSACFAAVRALWPGVTPSPGALIVNGGVYTGGTPGHPGHYKIVAVWGVVLLATATVGAYLATKPKVRGLGEKLKLTGPYPHDSAVSAWWVLFERWPNGRTVEVSCTLEDGSAIRGRFGSFNNSADDSPDRDLILLEPIFYRPPGDDAEEVPYDMSAVCFPARRIVALFVNYTESAQIAIPAKEQRGAAVSQVQPGPVVQVQLGPAPSAESPALSAATPSSGASTPGLAQAAPLHGFSGPSALARRLRGLRFC
jgi:hypothetical protein